MTQESDFAKQLVATWQKAEVAKTDTTRQKYRDECFALCAKEQERILTTGQAESTLIKVTTPKYRKAIATESGKLDPSSKGGYRFTEYPMAFWKIDQGVKNEIDTATKIKVGEKKKNSTRVSVECREKLLNLANDLLEKPEIIGSGKNQLLFQKALAISLLTGRRFYVEVCRNAEFHELENITDYNRTLGFTGQAKGGIEKSEQVYELPTYAENIDLLISNTERVQEFIRSNSWFTEDMTSQIFQSKIKSQAERALSIFNQITMPYGFMITIKDLRALYMAFAYYDYKVITGKHPDIDSYLGSIAGHDSISEQGTFYRVGTTEHYKAFIDARWDD